MRGARATTGRLRAAAAALVLALSADVAASVAMSNTAEIEIGDVTMTDEMIKLLLPTGSDVFTGSMPSEYTVMHNSSSWHGLFFFQGHLIEQAYRTFCTPDGVDASAYSYTMRNHPLPINHQQTVEVRFILSTLASLFLLIPLGFSPAGFVGFVVHERSLKSKHLQHVSGASKTAFWVATFLFDCCSFLLLAVGTMLCLHLFGETAAIFLQTTEAALATFSLLVTFGFATLAFNYTLSFLFTSRSNAQIALGAVNFGTGFVLLLVNLLLSSAGSTTKDVADRIAPAFRVFPPYCLGEGMLGLTVAHYQKYIWGKDGSIFAQEHVGRPLMCLLVEIVGYFALTLVLDSDVPKRLERWWQGSKQPYLPHARATELDRDVAAEQQLVQDMLASRADSRWSETPSLLLSGLHKKFTPSTTGVAQAACGGWVEGGKHALRGLSLAVPVNECFGLLGVNGAGKTTAMSVLTGDLDATAGLAEVAGFNICDPATRRLVGYCPQVNPLLPYMTARETLTMFGHLKGLGLQGADLAQTVDDLIERVGLAPFADKPCGSYSGGNQRKLSFAVALIGEPPVVLLDEPSSGLDPVSRRQLWQLINEAAHGRSILLTSHLMEEVEALCNRVAIMVDGQFKCVGTVQGLKSRFSNEFQLEARCFADESGKQPAQCTDLLTQRVDALVEYVTKRFAGASVDERHGGFVRFKVPTAAVTSIADLFQAIEQAKQQLCIENYALSQGTLEQVFIRFAKEQEAAMTLAPPTPTKKKAAVVPFVPPTTDDGF